MDAGQVKELLTTGDIVDLLNELNANPFETNGVIACRTICHGGESAKLVYYPDTKVFHCFTDCGCNYDLFSLIQSVYNIDFPSAFKYICGKFGLNTDINFSPIDQVDTSFIYKFKRKKDGYALTEIDKKLLNSFYNLYHKEWIEDGISIRSMKKFDIKFSIRENKIIIPHSDLDGRLVGIRGRTLKQEEIEAGKKYMPIFHKGKVRKHPTGAVIYGLDKTKWAVKEHKTIILFESEKSVMQLDTMLPKFSIGGAISGSYLTFEQVNILKSLDISNVVIALDKEFEDVGSKEEQFYIEKVKSGFIDKLLPYFHVNVIWDRQNLLNLKDAPTDHGIETFEKLWKNKIKI